MHFLATFVGPFCINRKISFKNIKALYDKLSAAKDKAEFVSVLDESFIKSVRKQSIKEFFEVE